MSISVRCVDSAFVDSRALIEAVAERVRDFLDGESSGHDWEHIRRVWDNAKVIGVAEGADMRLVELGALLHDVDEQMALSRHETMLDFLRAFFREQGLVEWEARLAVFSENASGAMSCPAAVS